MHFGKVRFLDGPWLSDRWPLLLLQQQLLLLLLLHAVLTGLLRYNGMHAALQMLCVQTLQSVLVACN